MYARLVESCVHLLQYLASDKGLQEILHRQHAL